MQHREITAAPDYTRPALVMLGVNLFWVLFLVWAIWGLAPVLVLAALLHHGIDRLAAIRAARDAARAPRR